MRIPLPLARDARNESRPGKLRVCVPVARPPQKNDPKPRKLRIESIFAFW
jgi:hypothetical protein